jgi:hypothetical protein
MTPTIGPLSPLVVSWLRAVVGQQATPMPYTLEIPPELIAPLVQAASHRRVSVAVFLVEALRAALERDGWLP